MRVEVPLGDVVDRVTILRIKAARLTEVGAVAHVHRELEALQDAWTEAGHPPMEGLPEWAGLCSVNEQLWDVEDELRDHERRGEFGPAFVERARSVYKLNDRRAALKRAINHALGSRLVEQKSYTDYAGDA